MGDYAGLALLVMFLAVIAIVFNTSDTARTMKRIEKKLNERERH